MVEEELTVCSNVTGNRTEVCDDPALQLSLATPIAMMSAGVLGNLLALVVLFTADREAQRTPFFPLLVAMAVSDCVGQCSTGSVAVLVYANRLQWVGGRALCIAHGFAMVFFAVFTPLLVGSLSLDRLLALRFSYFYRRYFTTRVSRVIILTAVTFTLFFCTWPWLGLGSYELQYPGSWCFLNYHRESVSDIVYALVFSVLNIVIIVVIVVCNGTVVITLLAMRRKRHQRHALPAYESVARRKVKDSGARGKVTGRTRVPFTPEIETQMVWFLLAVTLVFSCLWLPINVHILLNQVGENNDLKRDLVTVRLAGINQIIDPWMYVILRKSTLFKCLVRLKRLILPKKASCPSPSHPLQPVLPSHPLHPPHSHSCPILPVHVLPPSRHSCPPDLGSVLREEDVVIDPILQEMQVIKDPTQPKGLFIKDPALQGGDS